MAPEPDAASFRDPSGFVFTAEGVVRRQVNKIYQPEYDHLMGSGLYGALVGAGLLVPHREVDLRHAVTAEASAVLEPEQLPFVSYPYEWCFSALKDAALATLRIQGIALDHGMSLRDASAFNIQFAHGRPMLIDTLSFETRSDEHPWPAYRQFCQHFLAPLALMATVDVRLGTLSRVHLDGVPLDLASALLPGRTRLQPGLQIHVHAHARSQRKHADGDGGRKPPTVSDRALRGLIDSLTGVISRLDWSPPPSAWRDYYDGDSYSRDAFDHKVEVVDKLLGEVAPETVWDLGANTGRFAQLAADRGAATVAFDVDPSAVETAYREGVAGGKQDLLPLVLDLANPSPAIGWHHRERRSLVERGPAGMVLALALVHHLAIANNVPLDRIADLMRALAEHLLIEFVPKSDPKVQRLLASREDIFPDYTTEGFEAAFSRRFRIVAREPLRDSGRVLYLLRGR